MSEFWFYLQMGVNHILDINGIDHLLFIVAMCVFFTLKEWKKLLVLITAFTIGHSVTLALSGLEIITVNTHLVEILIPITIILTCINNLIKAYSEKAVNYKILYGMVLIFGFIHGMGFSNFFKQMLFDGDSLVLTLLSFNLGIEVGQLVIVAALVLVLSVLLSVFKKLQHKHLIILISVVTLLISAQLLIEKF